MFRRWLAMTSSALLLGGAFSAQQQGPAAATPITTEAAYYDGRVKEIPAKKAGVLDAGDPEKLKFAWKNGNWSVPFSHVRTVYVSLSRRSALGEAFGLVGAAAGAAKKRKLLLSLMLTDEQGASRNCVFFAPLLTPEFLARLEERTGRKIVYESDEARQAVQQPH